MKYYKGYTIEEKNKEFWIRTYKNKDLIRIFKTEKEGYEFIDNRLNSIKNSKPSLIIPKKNLKKAFSLLNKIYKKEVLKDE